MELITEQLDILNEMMSFYKHLYSKRNTLDIDLNILFSGYNIPKLNESGNFSLEGPIKYEELLSFLKNRPIIPVRDVMDLRTIFFFILLEGRRDILIKDN